MYTKDDSDSAGLVDRIISAVIAGLCGYFIGLLLLQLLSYFFVEAPWVKWAIVAAFALFGFASPNRSRELWTEFWNDFLRFFIRGR